LVNAEKSNISPAREKSGKTFREIYEKTPHFRGKWQIFNLFGKSLRGKGYETVITFDMGQKICLCLDDWIPYQIFLTGYYAIEYRHTIYFRNLIKKGIVFFDVGANIGYYTLQASPRTGFEGKVFSFEPVSATYGKLVENISLNSLKNVFPQKLIVYEKECELEILPGDCGNTGSAKLAPANSASRSDAEKVRAVTLDSFVKENGVDRIDVVKIDVEGSEFSVLRGMKNILSEMNPKLLIELTEHTLKARGTSCEEVIAFLRGFGYEPYSVRSGEEKPADISKIRRESLVLFKKEE